MRDVRRFALGVLVSVAAFARPAVAQHPLTLLPIDDPAYQQLAALDHVGCVPARIGPTRPFTVADVRTAVRASATDPRCPALLVDALMRRFLPDAMRAAATDSANATEPSTASPLPAVPVAPVDSTLLAQTRAAAAAAPDTTRPGYGLRAGGLLSAVVTTHGEGEYHPLWQDITPTAAGTPPFVLTARGRLSWSASPKFLAVSEVYVQSDRRNDPTVRAKTLRRSAGVMDVGESYLNGQLGPVMLSLGRSYEAWLGHDRESIALSANGPLLDRLAISARWPKVQVRAIIASLDAVTVHESSDSLAPGTGDVLFHRALFGHVLTWTPVSALEVSAGETMLIARRGAPLDLTYANPVVPYIVAQNDTGRSASAGRDNLVLFGGMRARLLAATLTGELVVDDVQADAADQARTANQLAWRFEGTVPLAFDDPTIARVEYRRIDSFTYSRPLYSEVYQYYGAPLGSELGPDADMLTGELSRWPNGVLRVSAGVSLWRHGATRLDRRPAEGPNFYGGAPYPSTRSYRPEVQKAVIWSLGADVDNARLPLFARLELANIENTNNLQSPAALYVRLRIGGSYALHYP